VTARARGHPDRGLIAVVALAAVLNVLGIGWGLPPAGIHAWDVDAVAPMGPLIAAKRMILDDWWNSGYFNKFPMGHFFLLMAAYTPYVGYLWLTGGLHRPSEVYPFGLEDPQTALTVLTVIARSVSALMGVGIVILVYLTARRLTGRHAAFFSALTIVCSPAFIFYAQTGNVDTPSLFWCALGLFALGRILTGPCARGNYLLLGVAAGMAAATKEQTVGLFLAMPLSVVIAHARHAHPVARPATAFFRTVLDRRLLGGLLASIATFAVATHLVFNWDGNMVRLQMRLLGIHPVYGTSHPGRLAGPVGPSDGIAEIARHTAESMNPVLFAAGVAGLVVLWRRQQWARHFALAALGYAALSVSMMHFIAARFVMEVVLVFAFFVGPVLGGLWRWSVAHSRPLTAGLLLVWAYSFAYGLEVDYLLVRDARYDAERWLQAHAPDTRIEAFSRPTYLPRFPGHVHVRYSEMTARDLLALAERSPDFLVLSSAFSRRFEEEAEAAALLAGLLRGDFGYRPVRVFRREPLVGPRLFAGLSPEITILARRF
jgi:4-amino-4-deoxy-L-arabinose transferase-like glycosyltransferase